MNAPVAEMAEPEAGSLELVELELALNHQDFVDLGFEGTVRRAAEGIGGRMLFHMRMDGLSDCDWVAAVLLGEPEERKYALVVQPATGGELRVEDAAESRIPVARIAAPYASLIDMLDNAA